MYWTNRCFEPIKFAVSHLKVRPLAETLMGRNCQLFLSLIGEFDLGQAAIRKELARVKQVIRYESVLRPINFASL